MTNLKNRIELEHASPLPLKIFLISREMNKRIGISILFFFFFASSSGSNLIIKLDVETNNAIYIRYLANSFRN